MGLITISPVGYYGDESNYGNYQFVSLNDIIDQFMFIYVGEDKLIPKVKRTDVIFHAQRAMQELSFDTFKSYKAQELNVPATLQIPLPQDYINYTKISWIDSSGIKHLMYPTSKTSNPSSHKSQDVRTSSTPLQNSGDDFWRLKAVGTFTNGSKTVVLDGDYDNIITGMNVVVKDGITSNISNIITTSGITTITMGSNWGNASGDREIEFKLNSNRLIPKTKKTARITGSYTSGTAIITASSTAEAAKVEVGMFVIDDNLSHISDPWSDSPKVIDVQGDTITITNNFNVDGTSVQINFISYDFDSEAWKKYKSTTPSENNNYNYEDDVHWPLDGERYGIDPQHSQTNGSYYIDSKAGKIHFSSNLSGKTVILDYISDSLGTNGETQVHKFAEEAMYKYIMHAVLSSKINIPEYQVARFKKEKRAAIRQAKLRLSNLKLEELTQILRGKSKWIKH
tara:strand:- start:920 stop:2281 length:1362 start_codon:yes stop_codon:yes gene_type:complete